jgi:hypothetical protein
VTGLIISIRVEHIYEAMRLTSAGVVLKTTPSASETVVPAVQQTLYGKETPPKSNNDLTKFNKVIYKTMHESIVPKLGGTMITFLSVTKCFYIMLPKETGLTLASLFLIIC